MPAPIRPRRPGAAGAGVDVEQAEAIVLEAADRLFAEQEMADGADVAADAKIDRLPGQMIGVRSATHARIVAFAAAGRVDADGAEQGRNFGQYGAQRAGEAV